MSGGGGAELTGIGTRTMSRLVSSAPMFAHCDPRTMREVARLVDWVEVPEARVLVREGRAAREFLIVVRGSLRVERQSRLIASLGPGEYVGHVAMLGSGFSDLTVIADEPSLLIVFGRREFNTLMADHPAIELPILRGIARHAHLLPDSAAQ